MFFQMSLPCLLPTCLNIAVLLYCSGAPVGMIVFLTMNKHNLSVPEFKGRYGMLYENYRPRFYYWGAVRFGILLALTVAVEALQVEVAVAFGR